MDGTFFPRNFLGRDGIGVVMLLLLLLLPLLLPLLLRLLLTLLHSLLLPSWQLWGRQD